MNYRHDMHSYCSISVIIPIFRVPKVWLRRCLDSVTLQTHKEWEAILATDGPEECDAVCREYAARDSRFRILKGPGGYGKAVNRAIDEARGDYIAIVEADDWCAPDMLRKLHDHARTANADVVKAGFFEAYDDASRTKKVLPPYPDCVSRHSHPDFLNYHPSIWSALYRREFLLQKNIRFVEERVSYIDGPFHMETFARADVYRILREALYFYYQDNPGQTVKNMSKACEALVGIRYIHDRMHAFPDLYDAMKEYLALAYAAQLYWNYVRLDCPSKALFWKEAHKLVRSLNLGNVMFARFQAPLLRFFLALLTQPLLPGCTPGEKSLPAFYGGALERFTLRLFGTLPVGGIRRRQDHGVLTLAGVPLVRWQRFVGGWRIRLFGILPLLRLAAAPVGRVLPAAQTKATPPSPAEHKKTSRPQADA